MRSLFAILSLLAGTWVGHGADVVRVLDVHDLHLQKDGTVVGTTGHREVQVVKPVAPLVGTGGLAPMGGVSVPKSVGIELTRMSNEELGQFCLARQEASLACLRRVESIGISLRLLDSKVAAAKQMDVVTETEIKEIRKALVSEDAVRRAEYQQLRPGLENGLLEQKRRGLGALSGEAR